MTAIYPQVHLHIVYSGASGPLRDVTQEYIVRWSTFEWGLRFEGMDEPLALGMGVLCEQIFIETSFAKRTKNLWIYTRLWCGIAAEHLDSTSCTAQDDSPCRFLQVDSCLVLLSDAILLRVSKCDSKQMIFRTLFIVPCVLSIHRHPF